MIIIRFRVSGVGIICMIFICLTEGFYESEAENESKMECVKVGVGLGLLIGLLSEVIIENYFGYCCFAFD